MKGLRLNLVEVKRPGPAPAPLDQGPSTGDVHDQGLPLSRDSKMLREDGSRGIVASSAPTARSVALQSRSRRGRATNAAATGYSARLPGFHDDLDFRMILNGGNRGSFLQTQFYKAVDAPLPIREHRADERSEERRVGKAQRAVVGPH